mmetsp:Transcript_67017/g.187130  ORF Transcript_67017/g.187130 Transcript_67017/m.187130 type:complete len:289 (-) Transcript_67017:173-1039(-)
MIVHQGAGFGRHLRQIVGLLELAADNLLQGPDGSLDGLRQGQGLFLRALRLEVLLGVQHITPAHESWKKLVHVGHLVAHHRRDLSLLRPALELLAKVVLDDTFDGCRQHGRFLRAHVRELLPSVPQRSFASSFRDELEFFGHPRAHLPREVLLLRAALKRLAHHVFDDFREGLRKRRLLRALVLQVLPSDFHRLMANRHRDGLDLGTHFVHDCVLNRSVLKLLADEVLNGRRNSDARTGSRRLGAFFLQVVPSSPQQLFANRRRDGRNLGTRLFHRSGLDRDILKLLA